MSTPHHILQQYWQHNAFRGEQEAIITAVLAQKDCLALLPTGGGKSICFQVPTMLMDGLCLVISPLIALMKDQVENLQKRGIQALAIHSGMNFYEVKETLEKAVSGDYKFLYVSPERLETNLFKQHVHAMNICLIAVDEAHCISQWGYDFRPSYLNINKLREALDNVPIIALTASATPTVQEDIISKLQLADGLIFKQSFERPNLSYSVFNVDSKINKAVTILTNVPGSSIVYCRNRSQTKLVAHLLSLQNISADYYHAGLSNQERNEKQQQWISNKTRVMVCTNAFGMGIDKPDVRTVIHYDTPDCLENYYQEAGRAGRDGKKSYAILLHNDTDITGLKALADIRFPVMFDVRKVYQALADFLHIPVGAGEGMYYSFDLISFTKNFQLNIIMVMAVLKALEQEGYISFSESVFLPSKVQFIAPKNVLNDIEQSHPKLDPVVKCLLRSYSGILDNQTSISEKQIAKLTRLTEADVKEILEQLQAFGIIQYTPQKESPQLHYFTNRAPAQYLVFNQAAYQQRKRIYQERVDVMLQYLQFTKQCRSQYISKYFGDDAAQGCGICDTCLANRTNVLSANTFALIQQQIMQVAKANTSNTVTELFLQLQPTNKHHIWQVLLFLQDQKLLTINDLNEIAVA